jgi:hypothetical protein
MNLETWIATATENLAPKAVVKVREDISMHVENAVNRYQLEGHSELEADRLAVNDLGEAKVAARGFEKTYLTVKEFEDLTVYKTLSSHQIWLSITSFVVSIVFTYANLEFLSFSWIYAIFFLYTGIIKLVDCISGKKLKLKNYVIFKIILSIINVCVGFLFLIQVYSDEKFSYLERIRLNLSPLKSQNDWKYLFIVGIYLLIVFALREKYFKWRKLKFL